MNAPQAGPTERSRASELMKRFWDSRARDDAQFYIATWRGYHKPTTSDFFESGESMRQVLAEHGYLPPPDARMLEIGCGIGRMTHGFAQVFGAVDAIDVSAEMVLQARENLARFPHVRVQETSGVDLGLFPDHTFDLCFSFIVFQHIPEWPVTRNYIIEAGRVLRPGGTFLFQVNNLPPLREYHSPLLRAASRWWRRYVWHSLLELRALVTRGPRGFDHPAWMGRQTSLTQVREALEAAGLELEEMTGQGTPYLWVRARRPETRA